jgi:hypothetical protein
MLLLLLAQLPKNPPPPKGIWRVVDLIAKTVVIILATIWGVFSAYHTFWER